MKRYLYEGNMKFPALEQVNANHSRKVNSPDYSWLHVRSLPLARGRTWQVAWAAETVQIKDHGQARQITLFEHGRVALQILTSDFEACPAEILSWLKSRWREENFLKYASENYGIDKICDYLASIGTNTMP
jgi:hypothetical protein